MSSKKIIMLFLCIIICFINCKGKEGIQSTKKRKPPVKGKNLSGITEEQALQFLKEKWQKAQNEHNLRKYSGLYDRRMKGIKRTSSGKKYEYNYEEWIKDRTSMINNLTMSIKIKNPKVSFKGEEVHINFVQYYSSQNYSDKGDKIIKLVKGAHDIEILYEEMFNSEKIDGKKDYLCLVTADSEWVKAKLLKQKKGEVDPQNMFWSEPVPKSYYVDIGGTKFWTEKILRPIDEKKVNKKLVTLFGNPIETLQGGIIWTSDITLVLWKGADYTSEIMESIKTDITGLTGYIFINEILDVNEKDKLIVIQISSGEETYTYECLYFVLIDQNNKPVQTFKQSCDSYEPDVYAEIKYFYNPESNSIEVNLKDSESEDKIIYIWQNDKFIKQ